MGFPPKTGAATYDASLALRSDTAVLTVSGCTVEQSTKILSFREWPELVAWDRRLCRTESFETWGFVSRLWVGYGFDIDYHREDDSTVGD